LANGYKASLKGAAPSTPKYTRRRQKKGSACPWNTVTPLFKVKDELGEVRNALSQAIDGPQAFLLQQRLQVASAVYEFKPVVIIDLGRGYGNSICAMAVAAKMLRPQPCHIVSICLSDVFNHLVTTASRGSPS
jgi:hypothetical protein